jgi:hypothetical protein
MRPPWAWRQTPLRLPPTPVEVSGADPPTLVHLVREVNGLGAFRGFAEALRTHPPGLDCDLVLAMKGFSSRAQAAPYLREAADLAPTTLFFPDRGMDLGVYLALAARLRRDRYCFVNSHSRPLVEGWLAKLDAALARPGVGQVGATGSWASMHSWVTNLIGLPSAYKGLLPPRAIARQLSLELQREAALLASDSDSGLASGSASESASESSSESVFVSESESNSESSSESVFVSESDSNSESSSESVFVSESDSNSESSSESVFVSESDSNSESSSESVFVSESDSNSGLGSGLASESSSESALNSARRPAVSVARLRFGSILRVPRELAEFAPFPAAHLRTNVFMVSHAALRELDLPVVQSKIDAQVVESGRESITAQLARIGLCSLVVDRTGAVHGASRWERSRTLWQSRQERLLVADNQTRCYTAGTFARRDLLSTLAWGVSADPAPPREGAPAGAPLLAETR